MKPNLGITDLKTALDAYVRQQRITMGLIAVIALLALQGLMRTDKVILEPPLRTKRIEVIEGKVDGAWLQEMGEWVAHLNLDATPNSIDYQQQQVLRIVHPETHGDLQQKMAVAAKRLKDTNASTVFALQQVAPDLDDHRVALIGQLDTYVNGLLVSSRTGSYMAEFRPQGWRALLYDWKEVPNDDIWLERAKAKAAAAEKAAQEARNKPAGQEAHR